MQSIRLRPLEQERCNTLGWDNYLGEKVSLAKQNTGETIPVQSPAPSYLSPQQEQIASEETYMELPAYKRPPTTALSLVPEHTTERCEISVEAWHFLPQIIAFRIDKCVEQKNKLPELIRINSILLFQLAATGNILESHILWQAMLVPIAGDDRLDTNTICLDI